MAMIERASGFRNARQMLIGDFNQFDAEFDACIERIKNPPGRTESQRSVQRRAASVRASIVNDQMAILKRLIGD